MRFELLANPGDAMKNLLLMRHAKSSWDEPGSTDRDRPLNERGKRDAPMMGAVLREKGLQPDLIICSPALRARKTAKLIAKAVGYPEDAIRMEESIYLHGVGGLMDLVTSFPDAVQQIYLIGHNPDLTDLVNRLTDSDLSNVPTCGIASVEFAVDSWTDIGAGVGRLAFFDYPKRHRSVAGGGPAG